MKGLTSVLAVVQSEFDRRAMVAAVSAVAEEAGAQVTVLGVTNPPPDYQETGVAEPNLHEWTTTVQLKEIDEVASALRESGIEATTKQTNGKPYEQIIRAAIEGGHDLIMKPAGAAQKKFGFLFGSTDMQLFRLSPIPVWIFKPTPTSRLANVMVAVDLLAVDEEKSALAKNVLQWGKYVANTVGANLHVAHFWEVYRESSLRSSTVSVQTIDRLAHRLEQQHRRWLDEAIEQSGLKAGEIAIHFHKGDAEEMIPAISHAQNIDLIVMGTIGRTGIPGFFIGNTADSVLRQVNCSVLAIKPERFQTPIQIDH